jgi:heat shock protein HslJ
MSQINSLGSMSSNGKGEQVKRTSIVVLGLAAIAASAALGGVTKAQAAGKPTLTDQTWLLTKLGRVDRKKAGITVRFTAGGRVSGFSGCNTYSGTYAASGGSVRVSRKLAVTRKACAAPMTAQEKLYLTSLRAARTYSIAGGALRLKGRLGFTLATFGVQSPSLAGTGWTVVAYNNGRQGEVSVLAGTKLTANFDSTGHVSGFAGCNDYNGPVKAAPPTVAIGPLASTRKACATPAGVMEQESAYLAALASARSYSIQGTVLELRTADGAIAASFSSAG